MAVGTVSYSRSGAYRFPMHTGDVLIHANLNEVVSLAYNLMAHFSWDLHFTYLVWKTHTLSLVCKPML
jgi:hypothetical protein